MDGPPIIVPVNPGYEDVTTELLVPGPLLRLIVSLNTTISPYFKALFELDTTLYHVDLYAAQAV